ncbi:Yqey-like protein [compost metagenome]
MHPPSRNPEMKLLDILKEKRMRLRKEADKVVELNVLTLVVGECERVSKDADDLAVLAILRKMHGSNEECLKVACSRVAAKLQTENSFIGELLAAYTPTQLSASQIIQRITQNSITNMGDAMKWLKANCAGQYDGKVASEAVKQHFAG